MRLRVYQEITMLFVMDEATGLRVEKSGVAEFIFVNAKVVVEEYRLRGWTL